jgi:hypothetical protein
MVAEKYPVTSPLELQMVAAIELEKAIRKQYTKSLNNLIAMRAIQYCKNLEILCYYLPHISFCVDMEDKMAKQNNDFNLIDYRLTDEELAAFDAWVQKKAANPTQILTELAASDYKVSLTFVENSEAWCCTVTGKENAKFNSKCSLTSWADEPLEALYMGAFKVAIIFNGGKWATKQQSRRG